MNVKKDKWDKFEITIKICSSILIPILLLFYGTSINSTLKNKEIEIQYIGIATDILSEKPEKTPDSLRNWAVEILKKYSKDVPLSKEAIFDLKRTALPNSNFLTDGNGEPVLDGDGNKITY